MGVTPGLFSTCSCDSKLSYTATSPSPPNPDPKKFTIVKTYEVRGWAAKFSALLIKYDGCTNYEGHKVLVFKYPLSTIESLKEIDPHFCDTGHISPIARFEPTSCGWRYAIGFCDMLSSCS